MQSSRRREYFRIRTRTPYYNQLTHVRSTVDSRSRSKWKLGKASIDADIASFGHSVLEIEVMVATAAEVPSAEEEIARVAALLGAAPLSGAMGGKLETYIRQYCPSVLAQLIEAGVLRES